MKKIAIILVGILVSAAAQAQYISWSVKPAYSQFQFLSEQWVRVQKGGKWGITDTAGKEVVPCQYGTITDFAAGYCLLLDRERLLGVFSRDGDLRTFSDPLFVDAAYPYFSEGLLAVRDVESSWTYMTPEGTYPIRMVFQSAAPFIQGLAAVQEKGGDGSYLHIDKKGRVNRLGGDFTDTFLVFASSFTQVDGQNVALVVDGHNEAWFRDFSGRKIFGLGKVKGYDKAERVMTTTKYQIRFATDRRVKSRKGADGTEKEFVQERNRNFALAPVPSYTIFKTEDVWDLCYKDQRIANPQFNMVFPISETSLMARIGNLWGFLALDPNTEYPYCELAGNNITLYHGAPHRADVRLNLPEGASLSDVRVIYVTPDRNTVQYTPQKTVFSIDIPSGPDEDGMLKAVILVNSGSILYPEELSSVPAHFENPYVVMVPTKVTLHHGNDLASLSVTVVNEEGGTSAPCSIYVDGRLLKEDMVFQPKQDITFNIPMSINLEDLDSVTREVKVEIREQGCPVWINRFRVVFERNFN